MPWGNGCPEGKRGQKAKNNVEVNRRQLCKKDGIRMT